MTNRYVLFQAYGSEEILAECRFALMQLLQQKDFDKICVVIYTDNPHFFKNELDAFPYTITELITAEQIKTWRGEIDFVHRVKIKVLQDFFNKYDGNVLYCDTDTYCLQSLDTLFNNIENGAFYMHTNEGYITPAGNPVIKKWYRFLTENNIHVNKALIANISNISMWNAGVIGISSQHTSILQEVLTITDTIYPLFPRHTVEQFAFSYSFQKIKPISSAEDAIFHYWDLKEYRMFLQKFYAEYRILPVAMQAKKVQDYLPAHIFKEKMKYKKLPFYKKLLTKKWDISESTNGLFTAAS
jgi:lipopolysaccharide biosynthesis glycosyltransferase